MQPSQSSPKLPIDGLSTHNEDQKPWTHRLNYIAVGGNRHPAAADWDPGTGIVAFGSRNNIAIWRPLVSRGYSLLNIPECLSCSQQHKREGITELLQAHTDTVNAVKFHGSEKRDGVILFSGSVDKTLRLWRPGNDKESGFLEITSLEGHTGSINDIATLTLPSYGNDQGCIIVASASADGTIRIWRVHNLDAEVGVRCLQTLQTTPSFLPLAIELGALGEGGGIFLAAAGTKGTIQVYAADRGEDLKQQATLTGHDGWIRSLAISKEYDGHNSDLILASASQDKYIRLWRIHSTAQFSTNRISNHDQKKDQAIRLLRSKVQRVQSSSAFAAITFEALLVGHDDWIFTVSWCRCNGKLKLLSSSADSSLSIWEKDDSSGIWVCSTRLGEISAQKGSTTATGSPGGFWSGLWSPDGRSVLSLGRTGSWRLWRHDQGTDRWNQDTGVGGHTAAITSIAWARNGSYLLSTSSDQTTRLHAEWRRGGSKTSWHEFARPQIHGYDLNCVDIITNSQFISGADEKCLRVFDQPKATAELLNRLTGVDTIVKEDMPETADIPVLGLSNKAADGSMPSDLDPNQGNDGVEEGVVSQSQPPTQLLHDLDHPPHEDLLSRHTLWPEREKLYGHGFEISTVAASHDGLLVATACKASSIDHAVIRLYETKEWREVKPPLQAHSLTVTCLKFSPDDRYLLSVGRDRQWVVWERSSKDGKTYVLKDQNPKGHSRMILSAAWSPKRVPQVFFTAGRDKTVKAWKLGQEGAELMYTLQASAAVTAVDSGGFSDATSLLAYGLETGDVYVHELNEGGQVGGRIALTERCAGLLCRN